MSLSRQAVIRRFNKYKPKTVEQALTRCRVPLTYLDEGAYRRIYQIGDLPLVVKFPYTEDSAKPIVREAKATMAVNHSNVDIRVLNTLRGRKYRHLRQYMPEIYYTDAKAGVLIMKKYTPLTNSSRSDALSADIEKEVGKVWAFRVEDGLDCEWYNLGRDEQGKIVILDFGLFEE